MVSIARFRNLLLASILLCAVSAGVHAQSFSVTHAKVDVVAEHDALRPGRTAWIGILFNMEKGWHIYWKNPGDSGAPPRVQWELPAGFRAGEIRWPVPVRLGTGTIMDYGYEGRVLLALPLAVPSSYKPGTPATLKASVSYLICRELCIPAKAQAALTIPSSNRAAQPKLFDATRESWPKPAPKSWKAQASSAGDHFVLSVETGSREPRATFFPFHEGVINNVASQSVTPMPRGVRIALKKSNLLTKPVTTLRGVVVFGPDRAFDIAASVATRH